MSASTVAGATETLAMAVTWMKGVISPQYEWFQAEAVPLLGQVVIPQLGDVWHRMEVPAWDVYSLALKESSNDVLTASQSTWKLIVLTLRPVCIFIGIILQSLWSVLQVLAQLLLAGGWVSVQKGLMQGKAAVIWFYLFQRSLTWKEVLGEIGICMTLVALYYFRKWLQRQTYYARLQRVYRRKKRQFIQHYTKAVNRVAQVSLVLAMAVPHAMFLGGCLAVKIFFPRLVSWFANDTYATSMLSVWYPLIWTIAWIHNYHSFQKQLQETKTKSFSSVLGSPSVAGIKARLFRSPPPSSSKISSRSALTTSASKTSSGKTSLSASKPSYLRPTAAERSRVQQRAMRTPTKTSPASSSSSGAKIGFYPRTTPSSSKEREPETPAPSQQAQLATDDTEYWLRYWVIYASLQAMARTAYLIPIVGSFVTKHPMVLSIAVELKLGFFVWLFGMERMLSQVVDAQQQDAVLVQALPQNLLHKHVTTVLVEFHAIVSEAVSKERWESLVVSKSKSMLSVFVMVKFLSEARKDWLLHMLEESRPLVLPSITLLMPGFITQFGVVYVQYLLPSANSLIFQKHQQDGAHGSKKTGDDPRLLYLKYWVLHCMWAGFLSYFASILWWIPFSTHMIYLTWCHLSFPQTIQQAYRIFELELIGFGLLQAREDQDDVVLELQATKTAQLFSAISSRLPSAASSEMDDGTDKNEDGEPSSDYSVSNSTTPSTQTQQALLKASSEAVTATENSVPALAEPNELDVSTTEVKEDTAHRATSIDMVGGIVSTAVANEAETTDENVVTDVDITTTTAAKTKKNTSTVASKRKKSPTSTSLSSSSSLKQASTNEESDYSESSHTSSSEADGNDENAGAMNKSSLGIRRSTRRRRKPVERTNF